MIGVSEDLEVDKELGKARPAMIRCVGATRDQFGPGNRVQGEGIDNLTRSISG